MTECLLEHKKNIYLSRLHIYLRLNIITQNPSQYRSRYKNYVIFDPQTQNKSIPIPKPTSGQVRSLTLKSSQSRPPRPKQVNFDAQTNTKRFAAGIQKTSQFRPPPPTKKPSRSSQSKQVHFGPYTVNFDPLHKNKSLSIPTLKPSQIRSRTRK